MSVVKSLDDLNNVLTGVNGVLIAAQPIAGAIMTGITLLWKKYKEAHPDGTQEDFFALLRGEGVEGENYSADWLTENGFTLVDGRWVPPTPDFPTA